MTLDESMENVIQLMHDCLLILMEQELVVCTVYERLVAGEWIDDDGSDWVTI